jgi:hypothetical protein
MNDKTMCKRHLNTKVDKMNIDFDSIHSVLPVRSFAHSPDIVDSTVFEVTEI